MCGIAGFIGRTPIGQDRIDRALALMRNRGPDKQIGVAFQHRGLEVALLHSRLSIIDLADRADQPFTLGDCTLVFNGEIYNYIELRRELAALGVAFTTESDTEVLLQSYLTWGTACVDRMEGMWAFAIFDRRNGTLFLSRDPFGEKPLYVQEAPEGFYFGSEIKFIQALGKAPLSVNLRHIRRFLVNGYKALYKTEDTFFDEIRQIDQATNLSIDRDSKVEEWRYWQPAFDPRPMSLGEAVAGARDRLLRSMALRLRADVPIAFCLSGGVDSSSLASIAGKVLGYDVTTFSIIESDERYNEFGNVNATIADLGCRHHLLPIPQAGAYDRLARLVGYHDAPLYTITYYIKSFMTQAMAENDFRVSVSGVAADELFTGYYDHHNLFLYDMRDHPAFQQRLADWRTHIGGIVRTPYLKDPELYLKDPSCRAHIYLNNDMFNAVMREPFAEPFVEMNYAPTALHNRMINQVRHENIPQIMHEEDLDAMHYSIENRSPFLDRELLSFAYSMPTEHLIRDGYGKYVLRQAMDGILNDKVRNDRHKKGFNASIASLFDLNAALTRAQFLDDGPIFELVDRDRMVRFYDDALALNQIPNSISKFMFSFLNCRIFLEQQQAA